MTNILKNDKSTVKDEIALFLIIFVCLLSGRLLIVFRPAFCQVTSVHTAVLGVMLVLIGVMFIPGFLYRLFENTKR